MAKLGVSSGILMFAAVTLATGVASADYVCQTTYNNGTGSFGQLGYVSFAAYTGADCTGRFVRTYVLCSTSPTSTNLCASSSQYHYRGEVQLGQAFEALRDAAATNQRITVGLATCIGGAQTCAGYVTYNAN